MLGLRLYKRRIIALVVIATVMIPAVVFGVSRMISADGTRALTYAIPEGYETFKDATLYDCVARAYEATTGDTVPSDGLTDEQLALIRSLQCSGLNLSEDEKISDTTGIEKLTALQLLSLDRNKISEIDLSKNSQLVSLVVWYNRLTELDVTKNVDLEELRVDGNEIEAIDLSQNGLLNAFTADWNHLAELDVSHNANLAVLGLLGNDIQTLDVTNNALLQSLDIRYNKVSSIDLSNNVDLEYLDVADNLLVGALDVSHNTQLKRIIAWSVPINDNPSNQITELDVSHNTLLEELRVYGNNSLASLDVTNNTQLRILYFNDCNVSEIDLSNNLDLEELSVGNELNSLDVSHNTKLKYLNYRAEKFSAVDTSNNLLLNELWTGGSALSVLDLSYNTALEYLVVGDYGGSVSINEIDITHNDFLKTIYNPNNLPVRADISYSFEDGNVLFDFSKLGFISSIDDTVYYNYDANNKVLVVSELDMTNGYAAVNAYAYSNNSVVWSFSKLILSDYVLTLDDNSTEGITSTLVCLPEGEGGDSCTVILPGMDSNAVVEDGVIREFLGWADTADAVEPQYMVNEEMVLTGRRTVYAVWQDVYTYTLNYDLNYEGASGVESISCSTADGQCEVSVTMMAPTRMGYVFLGWADTANANEGNNDYIAGASITLTGNKTLYAIWAPEYMLNFEVGESDTQIEPAKCYPTKVNGTCEVTIPKIRPVLEDYEFFGWTKTEGDTMADYLPGESFGFTAGNYAETLYAIWADGKVTWVQGQDTVETDDVDAILVIDYPSRSFVKLFIDGKEVDEKYYTIESENTRITISSEYLEILGPGTHTLEAVYEDDITVKTLFNIEEKESEIKVPDTGNETHDDNGANVVMLAILPAVGVAMMTVMVWMVLRKYHAMRKW